MHTGAGEADKDPELRTGPLRRGRGAIAADVVAGELLEGKELHMLASEGGMGEGGSGGGETLRRVSGSISQDFDIVAVDAAMG